MQKLQGQHQDTKKPQCLTGAVPLIVEFLGSVDRQGTAAGRVMSTGILQAICPQLLRMKLPKKEIQKEERDCPPPFFEPIC